MSRARLVTGDKTVVGPGEKRFLQCAVLKPCSGSESDESPGIPSGLLFMAPLPGLGLVKALTVSISGRPMCRRVFFLFLPSWKI